MRDRHLLAALAVVELLRAERKVELRADISANDAKVKEVQSKFRFVVGTVTERGAGAR